MATKRSFFTVSKWLHKYVGLTLLLFFLFMGVTGILINHPSLLRSWSVPTSWLGESYQYTNWNRFSFRDSVITDDGAMYIGGKLGVWYSQGAGFAFTELNRGLPESFYMRDINTLLTVDHNGKRRLFAGGRGGLFFRDQDSDSWKAVSGITDVEIVDLLLHGGRILAFGSHACYTAAVLQEDPVFEQRHIQIETAGQWVPGYRLLFELHSGKLFGLPGRLVVDTTAIVLLFLCISALYIYFIPWKNRTFRGRPKKNRWLKPMYSSHLLTGIWISLLLFIIASSGVFIRPPLILFSGLIPVPLASLAGKTPEILRAAIAGDGSLVLATRDGWYKGDPDFTPPLQPVTPPVPVFAMGTTVLEPLRGQQLLVGSFSGLYKWNVDENTGVDISGKKAPKKAGLMPGKVMAAAVMMDDGIFTAYADYKRGLLGVDGSPVTNRPFPTEQLEKRTSLYHFLFELHNGRFLRDIIGAWYILYVPLIGMALILVVFTGTVDWLKRKKILHD